MSNDFPTFYGNAALRRRLGEAIRTNALSHAYILEGAEGSGKRTLALHVAAALACERRGEALPCGLCPHCRRILGGMSPDVRIVEPAGTTISVDDIRSARSDMYLSSTEEETKVYIIDHADAMTVQAQNALLIVLEEPPTNLLILLLTDRADALLPTIRSRAALLRMSLLSPEEMTEALRSNRDAEALRTRDRAAYDALIETAAGCLGAVLDLLDGKKSSALMKMRAVVSSVVRGMVHTERFSQRLEQMQELPTKRAELSPYLTMMATAVRDLILLREDPNTVLCFYTDRAEALALAEGTTAARLLTLYDKIIEAQEALLINANVNLTLLSLFSQIN